MFKALILQPKLQPTAAHNFAVKSGCTIDEVDDGHQLEHNRKQNTPIRPIDSIFSEDTVPAPVPSPTPTDFRKAVYGYGVKALSKEFFVEGRFILQKLLNSFVPRTLKEQLDAMSAKIIMSIDLSNVIQVNALKLSLSRIVDSVNNEITCLFRQHLDDKFWEELNRVDITLCAGMSTTAKNLYQTMMTEGSINGKLDKKQLRIAIAKKKLLLLESDETDSLQLLDIIDLLTKHYGESTCEASKSIAKTHEKIYDSSIPLSNGFGRRVDLILATNNLELPTKAILTYPLNLPFNEADDNRVFTAGMDWDMRLRISFRKYEQETFFSLVLGTPLPEDTSSSSNIYLTPSQRRSQARTTTDVDFEDVNNEE
ncbi:hypothetical protein BDC45DRAFT_601261 [Circinella umbellata]|nr:hypothetical protein BDC45DRAFT_601261 [Circinella umbellata]